MTHTPISRVPVLLNDFRFEPGGGGAVEMWLLGGLELPGEGGSVLRVYDAVDEVALGNRDPRSDSWLRHDIRT